MNAHPRAGAAALALMLAASAMTTSSCLGPGDFHCTANDQCGDQGFCEVTGRCSVTDGQCPSGRRYVAHAGALGGQCVGDACPSDPIAELRAGAAHACILRQSGTVWCWGNNTDGQLGDETTTPRSAAALVHGLTDAKAIALGERHSCAVRGDGTLWCWGANADGQLGDGSPGRLMPAPVTSLPGVATDVAAGSSSTCALTDDGRVWCWGANDHGQLGDGSGASHTTPAPVFALMGARKIASRWDHVCALRDDATLWCWGANGSGQLGDGGSTDQPRPVRVTGLNAVVDVATGLQHTCASTQVDGLWCWGDNASGQLGLTQAATAQQRPAASALADPIDITAGLQHTCAVRRNGGAWCWGNNRYGQLGEGTTSNFTIPVPVSDLGRVVQMAAGERFTCARRDDGTVWCWGDNHTGQLGIGSAVIRPAPAAVAGPTVAGGAVDVSAGGSHSCAVVHTAATAGAAPGAGDGATAGEVVCWGGNQAGQLGDNSTADRATPGPTKPPLRARAPGAIAAGALHTCARTQDADTAGDAGIFCWGRGSSGQVGPRSLVDTSIPVLALSPQAGATLAVASGDTHSCALLDGSGAVWCWGSNRDGQLGDGTTTDHPAPAPVMSLSGAQQIAVGASHSCAVTGDGGVWCWGRGDSGQLGNGGTDSQSLPAPVTLPPGDGGAPATAAQVAAGGQHSCAVVAGGQAGDQVYCWGRGDSGQLGDGTTVGSPTPVLVPALTGATTVTAGSAHTCALDGEGRVWCWGANDQGQLGTGTSGPAEPTPVPSLTDAVQVVAGAKHTCARRRDATIWCWGGNTAGQLGDGVTLQRNTPQLDRLTCP